MVDLSPGDVLSYSAGSTQTGPMGFRKVKPRASMLAAAGGRWPELIEALGDRPVLFINAYPATIGTIAAGITVDTYLSPRVLSRALQLGRVADHPVIVAAQPLFIADGLLRHVAAGWPLPATLMIWVGGHAMPHSLERMLESLVAPHVDRCLIVQYFGAAEVDAGCLMARERDDDGELIYHARDDVALELDGPEGDEVSLALRDGDGETLGEPFRTGDRGRVSSSGDGWVIWNDRRFHPDVKRALRSWSEADWKRRTGYVRRDGESLWIQLRAGESADPDAAGELEHHEFARRFGFSWLDKPNWR